MEQIFKVGDRVFHIQNGWGTIVYSPRDEYYLVDFDDNSTQFWYSKSNNKVLSFTEYTLEGFSQERPEELPKKGDIVWVRDYKNEEWKITHFIGLHPTSSYKYRVSRINSYSNTIDYMYMTTTNPYANEHN